METIIATLVDRDFSPLGDDFVVIDDDFSEVVKAAKAAGQPCFVRWVRESDGQQGFYGRRGRSMRPQWFNT